MAATSETQIRPWLRPALRWLVLAAAVALVWLPWPETLNPVILPALSPFIAATALVSTRAVTLVTLLAVPVLVLAWRFPRWFCRHGCPTGFLQEWVERLRPQASRPWSKWPPIGQWLVWLTLGGAVLGYPLFLWLDPLAIFNGSLNAWRTPLAVATLLSGLGLPVLLLVDILLPRLWCQRLCPLGAAQDLLAGARRRLHGQTRCLTPDRVEGAMPAQPGRRWFFAAISGIAGALAARTMRGERQPLLRPPGALDEQRFTGACVRCGNCARVCPSRIIRPDFGEGGLAGFLAPQLRFATDYCREDCHRCNEVCPSGALARLSLEEKRRHRIGRAVVDSNLCLLAQGRECTACIQKCPYQALIIHSADGGFSNEPKVLPDRCNGCGACEPVCPVQPLRAIRIQPRSGSVA